MPTSRRLKSARLIEAIGVVALLAGAFLFLCGRRPAEDAITRGEAMIGAYCNYHWPAADDRLQRAGLWLSVPGYVLFAAARFAVWWTAD